MESLGTVFLSNQLAKLISERFNVDQALVASFLGIAFTQHIPNFLILILSVSCAVCGFMYFMNMKNSKYNTLRLFECAEWEALFMYMDNHLEFFEGGYSSSKNHPLLRTVSSYDGLLEKVRVNINDTDLKVEGYLMSDVFEEDKGKDKGRTLHRFIDINIRKGMIHPNKYIAELVKYKDKMNKDSMVLYFQTIYGDVSESYTKQSLKMFEGVRKDYEKRYDTYIKSYFNKERDWIWKYCSEIHFRPETFTKIGQQARINMLLYGPPGTGKSSIAYRLAVSLGRHLVAIDLKSVLMTCEKHQIHNIFTEVYVKTDSNHKDVIFLIEEFDTAIEYLLERKYNSTHSRGDEKIIIMGGEDMVKKRNHSCNRVDIEDLLDILQGPFPMPGSILIATTNKYEHMVKICPALFRPGRLTPVKIDHMDLTQLQAFSQYCFGKPLDLQCTPETQLMPAEIIEYAQICVLEEDGFTKFQAYVRGKLKLER